MTGEPSPPRKGARGRRRRLLLVGGGHSHLEVIRRFHLHPPAGVHLTLLSAFRHHHYSGMVPGYLSSLYSEAEVSVNLERLMEAAGGSFTTGRAVDLDPAMRQVRLEDGRVLPYDLVSFGIGSTPKGSFDPGVATHAQIIKPLSRVVQLKQKLMGLGATPKRSGTEVRCVVVGAGAAGIEIALALAAVLDAAKKPRKVLLLEGRAQMLPGSTGRYRRRVARILTARSIRVHLNTRVKTVEPGEVFLADGTRIVSQLTVWLAGAVGSPVMARSGLAVDSRGFLLVDAALRSISDPRVFAAGDCATLAAAPDTPKAGVYAVRQGPVLWQSLKAALSAGAPPSYTPQRDFLSILNTADGRALLRYKGLCSHSRWAWRLKDSIDRRFMARYQHLQPGA